MSSSESKVSPLDAIESASPPATSGIALPAWAPAYLAALRTNFHKPEAARAAGIDIVTVVELRDTNPDFAAQERRVMSAVADLLEAEALRRATAVPVTGPDGKPARPIGSDRLLLRLMERFIPGFAKKTPSFRSSAGSSTSSGRTRNEFAPSENRASTPSNPSNPGSPKHRNPTERNTSSRLHADSPPASYPPADSVSSVSESGSVYVSAHPSLEPNSLERDSESFIDAPPSVPGYLVHRADALMKALEAAGVPFLAIPAYKAAIPSGNPGSHSAPDNRDEIAGRPTADSVDEYQSAPAALSFSEFAPTRPP